MIVAVLASCLLVFAACSSSKQKAVPGATVPTDAPHPTTTDPYAVPATIDVAYATRVMAGLDAITGDIVRLVVSNKTSFPREAFDRLKAIYADDETVNRELALYRQDLDDGFANYKSNPGNKRSTVAELITASRICIYFRVQRDYSAVGIDAATARTEWIALRPLDPSRDPNRYNYTGWAYLYEGFTRQRTQPDQNPCGA